MQNKLFEAALGVEEPWYVKGVDFDAVQKTLTIVIDFVAGSRFEHPDFPGEHPVHDTQAKRYRHLHFFQHECYLEVRAPRIRLPDGSVTLMEPPRAGKLSGFTLLFEALVLAPAQQMPFAAVARTVGESWMPSVRATSRWPWRRRTRRVSRPWPLTKPRIDAAIVI